MAPRPPGSLASLRSKGTERKMCSEVKTKVGGPKKEHETYGGIRENLKRKKPKKVLKSIS